jgi:hypothetical protein
MSKRSGFYVNLTPPKPIVFWISVVLAVAALLLSLGVLNLPIPAFWLMGAAYLLLVLGNALKDM